MAFIRLSTENVHTSSYNHNRTSLLYSVLLYMESDEGRGAGIRVWKTLTITHRGFILAR